MGKNCLARAWLGILVMVFLISPLLLFPGPARATMVSASGGWLVVDKTFLQMFSFNSSAFYGPRSDSVPEAAEKIAREYGLPPQLVKSIIRAESGGEAKAVSAKGAKGLMQLMPETAREYRVFDPFDPLANIKGGVQYLRDLLQEFSGNLSLALAAYNAGPGAVHKYQGIPPYPETESFVEKVRKAYQRGEEPIQPSVRRRSNEMVPGERIPEKIHITCSPRDLAAFLQKIR